MKDVGKFCIDTLPAWVPAEFREVLAFQRSKGMTKYGTPCDSEAGLDWRMEALQELADAYVYTMCADIQNGRDLAQYVEMQYRILQAACLLCTPISQEVSL